MVVLAGTVAADPVQRRMPSGDEVTELRLSVPEAGRRLLPLPVAAGHATVGAHTVDGIADYDHGFSAPLDGARPRKGLNRLTVPIGPVGTRFSQGNT